MSIFENLGYFLAKNKFSQHNEILASGYQKNNFHFVTIIFKNFIKKVFRNFILMIQYDTRGYKNYIKKHPKILL